MNMKNMTIFTCLILFSLYAWSSSTHSSGTTSKLTKATNSNRELILDDEMCSDSYLNLISSSTFYLSVKYQPSPDELYTVGFKLDNNAWALDSIKTEDYTIPLPCYNTSIDSGILTLKKIEFGNDGLKFNFSFKLYVKDDKLHLQLVYYNSFEETATSIVGIEKAPDTEAPHFTSPSSVNVIENRVASFTVHATDISPVRYTIENVDTWGQYFIIDENTGVLMFKEDVMPNYEIAREYQVDIKAMDTSANSAVQTLYISIINEDIIHNGLHYESVLSPYTGETWLDRNIGAAQACLDFAPDNELCYGDYFQWGRGHDGHEKSDSGVNGVKANSIIPGHDRFIFSSSSFATTNRDWTTADRNGLERSTIWFETTGASVCPEGYRVPALTEITAEATSISEHADSFIESFLKLPYGGWRNSESEMEQQGTEASIYSANPDGDDRAKIIAFNGSRFTSHQVPRSTGISIRCIKDERLFRTPPVFTSESSVSVMENRITAITIVASDSSAVTYSIVNTDTWGQYFNLDAHTGVMTFKEESKPNYEISREYRVLVRATDLYGAEATREFVINILDEDIRYKGLQYETILSPRTGEIWLDRNLGAAKKCISQDYSPCYGDYYQWGRKADGHEQSDSSTTTTQAIDFNYNHDQFITTLNNFDDWLFNRDNEGIIRSSLLSRTDGSFICPEEYRVPTINELKSETLSDQTNPLGRPLSYENFLEFPFAGQRETSGHMRLEDISAMIWSSSVMGSLSPVLEINHLGASGSISFEHSMGASVRCIKN